MEKSISNQVSNEILEAIEKVVAKYELEPTIKNLTSGSDGMSVTITLKNNGK